MSINRKKVLASGTTLALGLSLFTAAPALANEVITLVPSSGTTYNSLLGSGFDFDTETDPSNPANPASLSYLISNASAKEVKVEFVGAVGSDELQTNGSLNTDGNYVFAANSDDFTSSAKQIVVTGFDDGGVGDDNLGGDADDGVNNLYISTSGLTADLTLKVQAWFDTNGDGKIGTFETKSIERTVILYKPSNVTGTLTLGQLVIGSDEISSSLTLNKDINLDQVADDLYVRYERNGSAIDIDPGFPVELFGSFSEDDGALVNDENTLDDDISAGVYRARAYVGTSTSTPISAFTGTQGVVAGSDTTVDDVYGYVLPNANVMVEDADLVEITPDDNEDVYARTGTKTVTVLAQALDNDGNDYAKAGLLVRAVIGENSLDAATKITIGGKTLESGDSDITVEGRTNADGIAEFTITSSTGAEDDEIDVDVEVLDGSSFDGSYSGVSILWEDAYVNSFYETQVRGDDDSYAVKNIKVGGSVTMNYVATDQFGQPLSSAMGSYRVAVDNNGGINNWNFEDTFAMTSGKVSVTVRDQNDETGSYDLDAELERYNTEDKIWEDVVTEGMDYEYPDTEVHVLDDNTAKTVEVTLSDDNDLSYSPLATVDMRSNYNGMYPVADDDSDYSYVYGYILDELGQPIPGAPVTVSGAGMQFIDYGYYVFAANSISVHTDDQGYYEVYILSHSVGDNVIRVSSGSASETVTLETDAASADAGSSVALSAPKSVLAGRTLSIVATLTDDFGNPVALDSAEATTQKLSVVYEGPGFVMSEPTTLNARGQASVRVLLAAGETGIASVSFSYTNGDGVKVTGSSATWVGPIANAMAGAKKGQIVVETYRAKGKTVSVFVGGTRVASFVADKINDRQVVRGIKSGDRNVRVVLSGPGEDFRGALTVK